MNFEKFAAKYSDSFDFPEEQAETVYSIMRDAILDACESCGMTYPTDEDAVTAACCEVFVDPECDKFWE